MPRFGNYLIRDMLYADVAGVVALEKEIFPSPWGAELFRYEIEHCERTIYLVAENDAELAGYAGAQVIEREVHVTNLAVLRSRRRSGLGSALLLEVVRRGLERGARWLTLEVRAGNDGGRRFYREFGFEELGLRLGYYTETGEDAVIMATGDIRAPEYSELLERMRMRAASKEGG